MKYIPADPASNSRKASVVPKDPAWPDLLGRNGDERMITACARIARQFATIAEDFKG